MVNLVELVADHDDCAFDQPCCYGHRVEGHAVYCHNNQWDDAPRKCRRTWYTNGEVKDEDCAGFDPNPAFTGQLNPTPIIAPLCEKCNGAKRILAEPEHVETCPLCCGSGSQPVATELTTYEQNTLELGTKHTRRQDTAGHAFVRLAENEAETASIDKLSILGLVVVRSVTFAKSVQAYLLENTMKGEAVMRANWRAAEKRGNASPG